MRRLVLGSIVALALTAPAMADRAITAEERAKLTAAVAAQQCTGGEMEFDDGKFEVDDAKCSDGKTYTLDFDAQFQLVKKELDD